MTNKDTRICFVPNRCRSLFLFFIAAFTFAFCLGLGGCTQPQRSRRTEDVRLCPGEADVASALEKLRLQRESVKPIRADGQLIYVEYDKGKEKKERFNTKLRFCPPHRLFFRANLVVGGEAIRLGRNEDEFWLRIKPEISSYWWADNTPDSLCNEQLLISPNNLIEALGVIDLAAPVELENDGRYDILTSRRGFGKQFAKKVYIDCCDYLVRKIEYFDGAGDLAVVVELNDYIKDNAPITAPAKINITYHETGKPAAKFNIALKNLRLFKPSEKELMGNLFKRPPEKGFKNVYKLNADCEFLRQ